MASISLWKYFFFESNHLDITSFTERPFVLHTKYTLISSCFFYKPHSFSYSSLNTYWSVQITSISPRLNCNLLTLTHVPQSFRPKETELAPYKTAAHKPLCHQYNSSTLSLSTSLSPKWLQLPILHWQKDFMKTSGQKEWSPPLQPDPSGKHGAT